MSNLNTYTVAVESRKLYSLRALAEFLQCSVVTAQKVKNSGAIPYMQIGRKVIFDTEKVLAALENKPGKGGK